MGHTNHPTFPSAGEILEIFAAHPDKTFRLRDLIQELGLRSSQARELKCALRELAKRRQITDFRKNHFAFAARRAEPAVEAGGGTRRLGKSASAARRDPQPAGESRGESRSNVVSGRLIGHRDGYGFVVPDEPVPGSDGDIFIPPDAMKDAMHGDRVEAQIFRTKPDPRAPGRKRLEGVILRVTHRAQKTVAGEFHYGARYNYVRPFDTHIGQEIVIPRGEEWPPETGTPGGGRSRHRQFGGESVERSLGHPAGKRASGRHGEAAELEGLMVDVEITRFPSRASLPRGRIVEILGGRDDFGVDVEIMIRKFHLPHRFPEDVLEEADRASTSVSASGLTGREDFRSLPVVTIDGETAKDFDDAIHVERLPGDRYLLQVHIADVGHYVRPGTALDHEARLRGTSVYFPDRAVPMLPLELSNGICSLNPRVERLVISVLMEFDYSGEMLGCRLTPGVIRSAERMTYTAVQAILSGDESARREYGPLVENFKLMEELAKILNQKRDARGSIDFDLPEPAIEFDEQGRMTGVTRSERNMAHRVIEEFMLAANEAVAAYLERRGIPALYRIHEKPDPKKVVEFEEIAATFGYSLGVELPAARRVRLRGRDDRERHPRFQQVPGAEELKITSRHYQRLTQRIAGKPEERILSYLMLRSLKQARYSEENDGHFALASSTYTHFTSPIRRYPDLIVHRILKAVLGNKAGPRDNTAAPGSGGSTLISLDELHALGLETSDCERRAAEAERELIDWKKVKFMASRIGDEFEALIISLTRHGFFVELTDQFVEGFVPMESFGDPGWIYREGLRALVHRDSRRAYHLGDRVMVRLDRIDREGNKLLFSVTG
ncbi:MAG TPA: VacB/RNase II family 3'-5' exoribonuclease [Terriglobia bacterium]|nr:VacB/RNase II family 3'-5' exoribonuclease [Terriglobia bacterium]